jgi:hypothetical protein
MTQPPWSPKLQRKWMRPQSRLAKDSFAPYKPGTPRPDASMIEGPNLAETIGVPTVPLKFSIKATKHER